MTDRPSRMPALFIGHGSPMNTLERNDFRGFRPAPSRFDYPAPGLPELAGEIVELVKPTRVGLDPERWGLDHGTWSVLAHLHPEADVPVAIPPGGLADRNNA